MRVAHYLTRGTSGLFYFRLRVPADLCKIIGVRLIKRATGTRCQRTALAHAITWSARYAQVFDALQGKPMARDLPPDVDDILNRLARGNFRRYEYDRERGILKAENAEDHARLMEALGKIGEVEEGHRLRAPLPSEAAAAMTAPPARAAKRIALKEAMTKWEKAIKNTDPKTIGAKVRAVNDLLGWKQAQADAQAAKTGGTGAMGSPVFVDDIDETVCGEWFIDFKSQRKFSKKLNKEIEKYSPGTMDNKFIYAAGFFDWAMTNGYYPKRSNPARGHANVSKKIKKARAKSHGAQAFDPEQISVMFQAGNYQRMRSLAARWAPLLLLYTGARSNEIGRLELADIYEYPKGCLEGEGTKVLSFSLVGDDKSLKNDHSARLTPIHPHLIDLGFWDHVTRLKAAEKAAQARVRAARKAKAPAHELAVLEAAEQEAGKLFPTLTFSAQNGPANAPQSAFRRMLKEAGIKARGAGKVGHHSFRDTVIDKMKQAGVTEEVRQEYTGHDNASSENADAYEQKFSPVALAEKCHPVLAWGLDLDGLRPLLS